MKSAWRTRTKAHGLLQKLHRPGVGRRENYDLCLNSGVLGEEHCVQLIVDAVK